MCLSSTHSRISHLSRKCGRTWIAQMAQIPIIYDESSTVSLTLFEYTIRWEVWHDLIFGIGQKKICHLMVLSLIEMQTSGLKLLFFVRWVVFLWDYSLMKARKCAYFDVFYYTNFFFCISILCRCTLYNEPNDRFSNYNKTNKKVNVY